MRNGVFYFIILFGLLSCFKTEDDTIIECQTDCTIITGQFLSANEEPIANAKVELEYRTSNPPFAAHTRKIKNAVTDENGFYSMKFYIKDEELGKNAEGYFIYQVDLSSLDQSKYIIIPRSNSSDAIYSISTRDTIINRTYYIPRKALIKVNLNNFTPIQEGDFFMANVYFPYGFKIGHNEYINSEYQTGFISYEGYTASGMNTHFTDIIVAENEMNFIKIISKKNGVISSEYFEIFIPEDNNIELTYDF